VSKTIRPQGGQLVRNTILNIIGQVLPLLVAIFTVPLVIRGLGEARFGLLALSWVVLGYFGIFDLGMGRAATNYVAEALGREDDAAIPPLVWSAVLVQTIFGVVGGVLLAALTPLLVGRFFTISADLVGEATVSFYLLAAAVPLVLVASSFRGVLEAAQRFDLINAVRVPSSIANYLLSLVGIWLGYRLPAIMLLLLIGRAVSALAFALLSFRVFPGLWRNWVFDGGALRRLLGFGGWITVSSVTIPILSYVEHFLIASLLSVGALTFYSAPFEMVSRTAIFPASVAITLFPAFSYYQASRREVIAELSWRPLKYLVITSMPLLVVLVLFAPEILALWLKGDFAARSTGVLRILAISFALNALSYVPFSAVQGLGRPDLKAKLDLAEVPFFVILSWILIPRYGVAGAALAKLGVTIVDTVGLFWMAGRLGAFSPLRVAWRGVRSAVFIAAGYGAISLVAPALAEVGIGGKLGIAVVAGVAYLVLVWRFALDAKDRSYLRQVRPWGVRREVGIEPR
jgi:O-antigen/teichoic acid export membrane protein